MSWGLVLAGISAASGLFNAYDEFNANRRIRQDLDQIKNYLIQLRSEIAEIRKQNTEILIRLDRLPDQIRQIVFEVVDTALLTERYSTVDDIRDNFLILSGGKAYSIRSTEWLTFSSAMGYLFDHENRISKIFDLVCVCEIALVITKERSLLLVLNRLDSKIEAITLLFNDLDGLIERKILKLKIDLDNTQFVQSHNLSPDLQSFGQLTYVRQPDRTVTQNYIEQVCHYEIVGRYDRQVRICKDVPRSRQIPDTAFHAARDTHLASISDQIESIGKCIVDLGALSAALFILKSYRDRISDGVDVENLHLNTRMYFTDEAALFALTSGDTVLAERSHALDEDFGDYTDGCNGDCSEIDPFRIKDGNKVFFREPIC